MTAVIHVVTVAIRAALIFGNVQAGDLAGLLAYTKARVPAFVNTFGAIDNVVVSAGAGAIALGFPVVVDIDLGENQVPGALESVCDHGETVKKSLELRSIKIKSKELPIPVAFAAAFEGEIIRKADMKVEFWSAKNTTCELVLMKDADEVEDHRITVDGPDIDSGETEYALATLVEVYGKKMQTDFESVIERKIHAWFNYMEGVMHTGQRNQFRIRVSNDAFDKGLRLGHFGEVLYHMIMDEFDTVVDKCQVTLVTDPAKAARILAEQAIPRYNMFPDLEREKFHYIGNSSLAGAYALAVSDEAREKIGELASNMTYMELSTNPHYMDEFVAACFLPHTNRELFPSSVQE